MSNPITSAPDPSESSSSDPLAGIITQVSPATAGAPSRGGPARPTRVAKASDKKKKRGEATAPAEERAAKSGVASTSADADDKDELSHSQKPSSTLVGTTTTKGSNIVPSDSANDGLTKDKPVDASATPTEPDPSAASSNRSPQSGATDGLQDLSVAAEKLSDGKPSVSSATSKGAKAQTSKTPGGREATSRSERTSSKTGDRTPPKASEKASPEKGKRKGGFMRKLIAILTCSMVGASAETDERLNEKASSSSREKTSSGAKKSSTSRLAARPAAKGSRAPSNRGSTDKTPGGGTRLPRDETGDVMSGAVVPPGSSFVVQDEAKKGSSGASSKGGDDQDEEDEEGDEDGGWMGEEQLEDDEDQTEEQRLIMQGGMGIPRDESGNLQPLLGPISEQDHGRKCLVLDLDETLVHSSFKMISNADFTVPVEIEGSVHNVYVIKRPGVDEFMRRMGELYEVVVFTASLSKYADPVLDILDIHQVVRHRLFRESCYNHRGNYVKDLSQLGRDIETSIIIDNSPASYIFHPNNAVPISSWFNDPHDTELTDLCPFLAELSEVEDVRAVLDGGL